MKRFSSTIKERLTGRHRYSCIFSGKIKGLKILDIGCSYGWFEKFAVTNKCKEIIGIEPEINSFYKAPQEVPSAKFKIGSALKVNEKNNKFDMVVMFDVIEHIPKNTEFKALKEISRVLKKNGVLVLSTDFDWWLAKILDPAWYFGHRHYSEERLKKMLSKTGFKIEQVDIKGRYFEVFGTILLYIFKWIFRREIPFKKYFDKKKDEEFLGTKSGFVTIFIKAKKL